MSSIKVFASALRLGVFSATSLAHLFKFNVLSEAHSMIRGIAAMLEFDKSMSEGGNHSDLGL